MRRANVAVLAVVVVFVALSSAGCTDKRAAQIRTLTRDRNQLSTQREQLRTQLNKAHQDNASLESALAARGTELTGARAKIRQLESKADSAQRRDKGTGWTQTLHGAEDSTTPMPDSMTSRTRAMSSSRRSTP